MASEVGVLDIDPATVVKKGRLAARAHVPGRHRAGPHHRRRGDQGRARRRASLPASGSTTGSSRSTTLPDRPHMRVPARRRRPPPADLRLHHRGAEAAHRAHGQHRRRGASGRWAPTRRSPCCRPGRGCCSTTSPSCSPRSRTRRSTRSARSWSRSLGGTIGPEQQPARAERRRRAGRSSCRSRSSTTTSWPSCSTSTSGRRACRGFQRRRAARPVPGGRRRRGAARRARRHPAPGQRGHRRRRQHPHPVRPPLDARAGADPVAAAHVGGAPPPHPGEDAARGSGLVVEAGDAREVHHMALLHRVRRRRHQPVPGVRDDRGHDRPRPADRRRARRGGAPLHQGRRQGRAEGDVEDGHLHRGVLHRRPGLRGHRPRPGAGRRVLHRHHVQARRHRPRRDRRRGRAPATGMAYPDRPSERAHRELEVGGEYQWRREGEYHLFNPDTVFKLQHATRAKRYDIFKEYTRAGRRAGRAPGHAARPVRARDRRRARRCRSTRSSRSARSSSGSRPAR